MTSPAAPLPSGGSERKSPDWWLQAVRDQERRGELLAAFDLAERGLSEYPDDVRLKHRAVLALARTGATAEAARRFDDYRLAGVPDEDVAALRARIAKDVALSADGADRARQAAHAASLYHEIFTKTGGYYPAINAATLWLVAGYGARSRELARTVLELVGGDGHDSYYEAATQAEAHLLCRDPAAAALALRVAAAGHGGDYGALATTRRQLRTICGLLDLDPALLSVLAGPAVVHFCGHRIAGDRFPADAEATVASRMEDVLRNQSVGYAYGSLASGADILWAEAVLTIGGELHVVLPFARDEFVKWSVAPAGREWVERFDRCLVAATSVRYATDDAFLGDDVLFRYASEFAMGLVLLRARYLDAEARQLAVWDRKPASDAAGTAIDVATWRRGGRPVTVVSPSGRTSMSDDAVGTQRSPLNAGAGRSVRALLFGDIQGFSKLTDEQLPVFATRILGAVADVLSYYEDVVYHRNTWGDAVYVVLRDAATAAACALDLQAAIGSIDLRSEGLPEHLALRLGGHLGPVFATHDPVLRQTVFMGSHVSRTARIEPVTPPGAVYVTEPFAAVLELDGHAEFVCDYVGHMDAAKDYGRLRMYRLRRG